MGPLVPGVAVPKLHSWVRGTATNHIAKADPVRLKAVAEVLGLDYRELLALTDQLGEVEQVERATQVAPSPDVSALVARLDRQAEVIDRLAGAVELLARGQDELLRGFLEGLADLRRVPAVDPADASLAGTR